MEWWEVVWTIVKAIVTVLVSLGVVSWLRKKALESKTVQKYHLEALVNRIFDWIVQAAETWGKNEGRSGMAQREYAIQTAKQQFPDMDDSEIEKRVDAAYIRQREFLRRIKQLDEPKKEGS